MSIYIYPNHISLGIELFHCFKPTIVVNSEDNNQEKINKCVIAILNLTCASTINTEIKVLIDKLIDKGFFVLIIISDDNYKINGDNNYKINGDNNYKINSNDNCKIKSDLYDNHWHNLSYSYRKAKILFGPVAEGEEDLVSCLERLENELVKYLDRLKNELVNIKDEEIVADRFRMVIREYILGLD